MCNNFIAWLQSLHKSQYERDDAPGASLPQSLLPSLKKGSPYIIFWEAQDISIFVGNLNIA